MPGRGAQGRLGTQIMSPYLGGVDVPPALERAGPPVGNAKDRRRAMKENVTSPGDTAAGSAGAAPKKRPRKFWTDKFNNSKDAPKTQPEKGMWVAARMQEVVDQNLCSPVRRRETRYHPSTPEAPARRSKAGSQADLEASEAPAKRSKARSPRELNHQADLEASMALLRAASAAGAESWDGEAPLAAAAAAAASASAAAGAHTGSKTLRRVKGAKKLAKKPSKKPAAAS